MKYEIKASNWAAVEIKDSVREILKRAQVSVEAAKSYLQSHTNRQQLDIFNMGGSKVQNLILSWL